MSPAGPGEEQPQGGHARPGWLLGNAWAALRLGARACPWWLAGHVTVTVLTALVPIAVVWLLKDLLDALTGVGPDGADGGGGAIGPAALPSSRRQQNMARIGAANNFSCK